MSEQKTQKPSRHVVIALNHLRKRRTVLEAQDRKVQQELEEIDIAIKALEPEEA